jgi:hypothetical protein
MADPPFCEASFFNKSITATIELVEGCTILITGGYGK